MKFELLLCLWSIASFTSSAAAQTLNYSGLPVSPLGQASLALDGPTGWLRVGNLSGSGLSGFTIQRGAELGSPLSGLFVEFDVLNGFNNDIVKNGDVFCTFNGVSDQLVASTESHFVGGLLELSAQFPFAASSLKDVVLRLDGVEVGRWNDVPGPLVGRVHPPTIGSAPHFYDWHVVEHVVGYTSQGDPILVLEVCMTYKHNWSTLNLPVQVDLPGYAGSFTANSISIVSEPVIGVMTNGRVTFTMANSPDVLIRTQGIVAPFGREVIGLGSALIAPTASGAVAASNIGSSGDDGLVIDARRSQAASFELDGLPLPGSLPVGARLEFGSLGVVNGLANQDLGSLRVIKAATQLVVESDYGPGVDVRVQLYLAGALVRDEVFSVQTNLLRFAPWPTGCGKRILWPIPYPCFWINWENPVLAVLPNVGAFQIDEARFLAVVPNPASSQLDRLSIRAQSVPSFAVEAFSREPVPEPVIYCTAKTNSLGCTPAIGFSGDASASIDDFTINASNIINQRTGFLIYGAQRAAIPFQGGFLCVQPPTRRTPPQSSGGSSSGLDCSGVFTFDFTNALVTAAGAGVGDVITAQYWYRDPQSPSTTGLTDAIEFTWRP